MRYYSSGRGCLGALVLCFAIGTMVAALDVLNGIPTTGPAPLAAWLAGSGLVALVLLGLVTLAWPRRGRPGVLPPEPPRPPRPRPPRPPEPPKPQSYYSNRR